MQLADRQVRLEEPPQVDVLEIRVKRVQIGKNDVAEDLGCGVLWKVKGKIGDVPGADE